MRNLPFALEEYEERLQRIQSSMRFRDLDAIVVTTAANFRYFTGLDTQFWESPTRPWFLVLPSNGESIAVVPGIAEVPVSKSAVGSIRTWNSPCPEDEGVSLLASVLKALRARFGRLGFELGMESTLRMSLLDYQRLTSLVSPLTIVDGASCLWEVRNIKSVAEVEKIRKSCAIVGQSLSELPGFASKGSTEFEVCRDLSIDMLKHGIHTIPYMACASGQGGYDQIIARGSDRELRDGDLLVIDVGATVDGYFCDFDRNYAVGKISDNVLRANDAVWRATEAGIHAARSGAHTGDLWAAMTDVLMKEGMKASTIGRCGHGLGLQLTEPPSNRRGDMALLMPGMVITLEPGMEYESGKLIVHEENILITEDGLPELLTTRAPRELWQIG